MPEIGSIEEDEAAAGGLPILPRMVDGKQRPGTMFVLERRGLALRLAKARHSVQLQQEFPLFSCAIPILQRI